MIRFAGATKTEPVVKIHEAGLSVHDSFNCLINGGKITYFNIAKCKTPTQENKIEDLILRREYFEKH